MSTRTKHSSLNAPGGDAQLDIKGEITQSYGHLSPVRIGLDREVRHRSVAGLNRMLAHALALRDLYKKNHWQTSGVTFYQLHLLF
jgi:starvation-inducible DNA-binding protein